MLTIATHNGRFHADEVMACSIIKYLFPQARIVRTRKKDIIDKADFVVDVGYVYDPKKRRFDHHQFQAKQGVFFEKGPVPMSSIGMVYKSFGMRFIRKIASSLIITDTINNDIIKRIYRSVYYSFIQEVDKIDNGIVDNVCETSIAVIISKMNSQKIYDEDIQTERFNFAVNYAFSSLYAYITTCVEKFNHLERDTETIERCFENRIFIKKQAIMIIDTDCPNWLYCLRNIEKEDRKTAFVLYKGENDDWVVKAINCAEKFKCRAYLQPADAYPFEGVIFVHQKGFIGIAKNLETAKEMALYSISNK